MHRDAVGHHQGELVRRLDLVRAAQQVRHRRVLGRDPEQRADLDEEGGDEQPPQRADERDREEQPEAQQVADDHDAAPVELVGQRAGQGAEHEGGQQLGGDDAAEREALRLVAGGELGGERGEREQAQPVARRGDGGDQPEPAERGDGQDAAHAVRRGRRRRGQTGRGRPGRSGAGDDRTHPLGTDAHPGGATGRQGSRGPRQDRVSARRRAQRPFRSPSGRSVVVFVIVPAVVAAVVAARRRPAGRRRGHLAAADLQQDRLARQRGAVRVLPDDRAAVRAVVHRAGARPSSRPAPGSTRASFWPRPTTSGTFDSAPPSV